MPRFIIRREYFKELESGKKKAEIRVGPYWLKIARQIMDGTMSPIAIFQYGRKRLILPIRRVEIYPTIKRALRNKRWKLLGLKAKTYKGAINEIYKMYRGKKTRPAIIFWLKNKSEGHVQLRNIEVAGSKRKDSSR